MNAITRTVGFAACAAVLLGAAPTAADDDEIECRRVAARIVATPIFGCPFSPIGLCTSGTIRGTGGLNGTTFFTGDSAAPGPMTAPNPAATISYSGSLIVTTPRGVLQLRDTGIFDQATGVFSSFDVVDPEGSDGKWAGVTGTLFIGGTTVNGQFVTTVITGEICLPED